MNLWTRRLTLAASIMCAGLWSHPARAAEPFDLKVMTFNVWYGGDQVSFPAVIEAIRKADADIVGVQEPDGNLARIAAAAGYGYVDHRRNLISRYPIFDPGVGERTDAGTASYAIAGLDAAAVHAWVMVRPGEVVAVANTHLSSDPYGPEAVRDGAPLDEVLALENRVRMAEAKPLLALGDLAKAGVPVFLTGDFNAPSPIDWSAAVQAARPDVIRYPVPWPVSIALSEAGLRDSYREAHPDAAAKKGFTWTAGMPHPYVKPRETMDRIDFVWSGGASATLSSLVVGEAGGPDVDIAVTPWPSDHRGVVSSFRVTPAPAPAMLSVEPRRVAKGDDVILRGHVPSSEKWGAVIVPRDAPVSAAIAGTVDEIAAYRQTIRIGTPDMAAGRYDAVLLGQGGIELKRIRFAIVEPGARPSLSVETALVAAGDPVRVSWSNAPGNRHDWIGIFKSGDASASGYLAYRYTEALFDGVMEIPTLASGELLAPGSYELRLMRDDSPTLMARAAFQISARP
jgi:endonuclease/exonuclease/phosphatase family metal-dependent hydrolase